MMEGIETVDAILAKVYPKINFAQKDKAKEAQADIEITRFKLNGVRELLVPAQPISLMINHTEKNGGSN